MTSLPCGICEKFIENGKESSIFCDKCKSWVHPKCNNLNFIDFQLVCVSDDPWFCFKCNSDVLPFGKLSYQNFQSFVLSFTEASSDANQNKENSTLLLKPPPNLSLLFNNFNNLAAESSRTNPENVINCKNNDIDEIQKISYLSFLTPVPLIRTLMTLNIYSKPLIRPLISLLLVNHEFSKTKK